MRATRIKAKYWVVAGTAAAMWGAMGCSGSQSGDTAETIVATQEDLTQRAYITSWQSDEVTAIDLRTLAVVGVVHTGGVRNHMAELNADFTKAYVSSTDTNELIVLDLKDLKVVKRVPMESGMFQVRKRLGTPAHPTHVTLSPDGKLLAVMAEEGDAVAFFDPATDELIKVLPGFHTPHFLRYTRDGRYGYVANL